MHRRLAARGKALGEARQTVVRNGFPGGCAADPDPRGGPALATVGRLPAREVLLTRDESQRRRAYRRDQATERRRVRFFAPYIAASARDSSDSRPPASAGKTATPTLTSIESDCPPTLNGDVKTSATRRARASASLRAVPGARTANSSP